MMTSPLTSGACRRKSCQCPSMPSVFPLWTGILLGLLMLTLGQKLPSRDEDYFHFRINPLEIFYDTKFLPDGTEVSTYLHKDVEKRFYFLVEEDHTPVSLIVTPCASAVEWQLSIQALPEEMSGDNADYYDDYEDTLLQQELALRSYRPTPITLQTYTGDSVATFLTTDSSAGIYVLHLKTTEKDSSVRMYATIAPESRIAYPEIPSDPEVRVDSVSKHSVAVSWKQSPTHAVHGLQVEYCLAVNSVKNFKTRCAALALIKGDIPPTAPPNSGFGFAWETKRKKSRDNPTTPMPRDPEGYDEETRYACVGATTSYVVNGLRSGRKYFVDVFAVYSNRSSAYAGVSVQTKKNTKKISLKEGKVITTFIKMNRREKLFKYRQKRRSNKLYVVILPCYGELQVTISLNGNVLQKRSLATTETIVINNATTGTYIIDVSTKLRKNAHFKIAAARRQSRLPFPVLPKDTSIKLFEYQRTCTTLTVAWLGSTQRYQYCLYAKEVNFSDNILDRILRRKNQCIEPNSRKKAQKVLCTNVRFKKKKRAVITKQITGLKKNTHYILNVYISKTGGRGETLSYQSRYASTRKRC